MTNNEWGELFDDWGSVAARDAYAIGAGISYEWPVWRLGYVGIEGQLLLWVGEQDHLELTVPIFVRTPRTQNIFIPSLAYGGGISVASEESETEIARTGSSNSALAHWFFEVEFGGAESTWRPYIRLHHRSDAWGTFDADTGSNAVLLGLRFNL
ncbi:MAG: hypothetical protein AAGH83_09440 [Pseudomonadota bacterium]